MLQHLGKTFLCGKRESTSCKPMRYLCLILILLKYSHASRSNTHEVLAHKNGLESKVDHKDVTLVKPDDLLKTTNKKIDHDASTHVKSASEKLSEIEVQLQGSDKDLSQDAGIVGTTYKDLAFKGNHIDEKVLVNQVMEIMQNSKSNSDVITQAFRFVKLDAHLFTLLTQLNKLQESQESLQKESIKQQTKFNIVLDEMRSLEYNFYEFFNSSLDRNRGGVSSPASNIAKESLRLTEVEERLESDMESMNDRVDSAIEKIIQSSVSTQLLLDLSKETIQQTDKSVGISNDVLLELKNVRTELGDVGQASVQTIYNVQKLEESLLMAMEDVGNKTISALRQDQQLQYQLLPSAAAIQMDGDEASLVPLGNGSVGNSMQADGTIFEASFPGRSSTVTNIVSPAAAAAKNDERKMKAQQEMQDPTTGTFNSEKNVVQETLMSPCSSSHKQHMPEHAHNCEDIQKLGQTSSGIYHIYPFGTEHNGTEVYCDLSSNGGGWTIIQRRTDESLVPEDFQKSWQDYASGFGKLHDNHWLGLDVISALTKAGDLQLQIELTDWEGETRVANYAYFRVANASQLYRLFVTDYFGDAGDSLAYHNGMAFSTKDRDNDLEKNANCAQRYQGAWWYKSCHQSNLNGRYMKQGNGKHESYANGVNWYSWHGYYYSLKRTQMKIRSRHFESVT